MPRIVQDRPRPDVEIAFTGARAAADFLARTLALPQARSADVELRGAGRRLRLRLRLRVTSWRRAPAGDTPVPAADLATQLIRLAGEAGGKVELAERLAADGLPELADLAAEIAAIRADVERLATAALNLATQDGLGWEAPEPVNRACRHERALAALEEPLGRVAAVLAGLGEGGAPRG